MASLTEMGFKPENHTAIPIVLIRAKESCTHTTKSSPSFEQFEAALIKQVIFNVAQTQQCTFCLMMTFQTFQGQEVSV